MRAQDSSPLQGEFSRLLGALHSIPHGLCVYDAHDRLVFVNEGFSRIYRQPVSSLPIGVHFLDVLANSVAIGNYTGRTAQEIWTERKAFIDRRVPGIFLQTMGDGRLIAITHQPLEDGGWAAIYEDITERRREEVQLHFMAHHDPLTHLPNRLLFDRTLRAAMEEVAKGRSVALLYLDLDGFKPVNDRLGHTAGDVLLHQVAERLRGAVREQDLAARLGGDEFALLLPNASCTDAENVAARLQTTLEEPFDLGAEAPVRIGVSIGIACAPTHAQDAEALRAYADSVLYAVKRARGERRASPRPPGDDHAADGMLRFAS